jgi:two-component system, sensor histidine kinase and response regulator
VNPGAVTPRRKPGRIVRALRRERATISIITVFVVLIMAMVGYNAWALRAQQDTPLVVNVMLRQRALSERYMAEILLTAGGYVRAPDDTLRTLQDSGKALQNGGGILAPTGNADYVQIPRPTDPTVRAKLSYAASLIADLGHQGDALLREGTASPTFSADLTTIRLTADQLSIVARDAAARETDVGQAALARLVWIEIGLGLLGAGVAVGMGLLLWRSGKRQSARFRSLVHNSSDLITVVDKHAVALYQSPSSLQVLGYEPDDVIGTKLTDLLHPNDKSGVITVFADLYEHPGSTVDLMFRLRHRNGAWVLMEGTIQDRTSDKTVGGFVVNTRDVTEREQIAAELAKARDGAMEASRMKSEFLASMSHEIRTPMNAVIGLTGLLLDTRLDREQDEYANGVRTAAEGLLAIINGILDFSKVEAGKVELELVDFDLASLVDDVVALIGDAAHDKDLELLAHSGPGLPAQVRGDPTRLRQILVNLVSNAVKFTATGEVVLSTRLMSTEAETVKVHFEVRDTGIGIAPEDQARMFDPFSQADSSTTRRFGGTGLGLAIAKQLIELMHGDLGCDSEIDRGTTFWFEIPLEAQHSDEAEGPTRLPDFEALRALIVDDNATNRLILHEQLSSWGMHPDEACDGFEALDIMRGAASRGEAYDLAVLDLNMPGMDGLELARTITDEPTIADARLFLLSSSGRVTSEVSEAAGLSGTLTKPVRQSELFNCLIDGLRPDDAAEPEPPPAPTVTPPTNGNRGTVLLVEDNTMNQLVASRIVGKLGYRVEIAENGREAITALAEQPFDAVLMDCQMPEMDGYEATREIRQREAETGAHLPVIAMTAAAMDGDREACLAAGMDDYITKPIRSEDIDQALDRWLAASKVSQPTGVSRHG